MSRLHTEVSKGRTLLVGFDVETTGLDVRADHIVSAAVVVYDGAAQRVLARHEWTVADAWRDREPDLEAILIHGISPAAAARSGDGHEWVLGELVSCLRRYTGRGHPLVGYNLSYDLAILAHEVAHLPAAQRLDLSFLSSIDILDARILQSKVRNDLAHARGKLSEVAACFGIIAAHSHDAAEDALTAVRLVMALLSQTDDLYVMDLAALSAAQPQWWQQMNRAYQVESWPFGAGAEVLAGNFEADLSIWAEELELPGFSPEEVQALREIDGKVVVDVRAPSYDDHGLEMFGDYFTPSYTPQALVGMHAADEIGRNS